MGMLPNPGGHSLAISKHRERSMKSIEGHRTARRLAWPALAILELLFKLRWIPEVRQNAKPH